MHLLINLLEQIYKGIIEIYSRNAFNQVKITTSDNFGG